VVNHKNPKRNFRLRQVSINDISRPQTYKLSLIR